ncbi:ubiquitin-conjugating enzyme/RWD-like protein [Pterulicium gracile]|uniref:Ubiquitin-conjugating enzyme/RWD-like protein n=1 Tax=Pterulicium gracile TaxID=1884261 RepID=A0A5C3QZW6_9AGAR|nr:ubiquitin-conjugating enzyme/RWD-like protein [Pterula gracilis]
MAGLNKNNAAIKRIMQEAKELANDPCTDYTAAPLEDDIFEWHCTIRGPQDTEFEGGLYHFRIVLPSEYPFRPPSILMLTPNGRFELNTKVPIIGLQGFFPLKGQAAVGVGSIETHTNERKRLAQSSRSWVCPCCEVPNLELLPDPSSSQPPPHTLGSAAPSLPPAAEVVKAEAPTEDTTPRESSVTLTPTPTTNAGTPATNTAAPATTTDDTHWSENTPPVAVAVIPASRPAGESPSSPSSRTPVLLDTTICVLLVLLFALICRKVL